MGPSKSKRQCLENDAISSTTIGTNGSTGRNHDFDKTIVIFDPSDYLDNGNHVRMKEDMGEIFESYYFSQLKLLSRLSCVRICSSSFCVCVCECVCVRESAGWGMRIPIQQIISSTSALPWSKVHRMHLNSFSSSMATRRNSSLLRSLLSTTTATTTTTSSSYY